MRRGRGGRATGGRGWLLPILGLLVWVLLVLSTRGVVPALPDGPVTPLSAPVAPPVRRAGLASGAPSGAAPLPTPIQHVFVVMFENAGRTGVMQSGPYERYLADTYDQALNFYATCHPSAPNYLALTSGAPWQCGSDSYHVYSTPNLGNELQTAGRSWDQFAQSMPNACDTNDVYPYAVKHVPMLYYADIVDNATLCDAHVQNFSAWNSDVASGQIPNFAYFTPNLLNDGHDTSVGYADRWLQGWLAPYLNASWFSSSVWFLTYDEGFVNGNPDPSGYNGTDGGHIYMAAVSPYVRANSTFSANASDYNLLATIEWLLGTNTTGHNDSSPEFPAMRSLFDFPAPPSPLVAAAEANITQGAAPLAVAFHGNGTGGTPPYQYAWSFGNGSVGSGPAVNHTFAAGNYSVRLEITDHAGRTANATVDVNVSGPPTTPVRIVLRANETRGDAPLAVGFTSNVTGGAGPYEVHWAFGANGSTATGPSVAYRYVVAGNFTATASATDAGGASAQATVGIEVCAPLALRLTGPTAAVPDGGSFTVPATVGPGGWGLAYAWTVNGIPVALDGPVLTYRPPGPGNYTVAAELTDPCAGTAYANLTVTVAPPGAIPPSTAAAFPTLELLGAGILGVAVILAVVGTILYRRSHPPRGPGVSAPGETVR